MPYLQYQLYSQEQTELQAMNLALSQQLSGIIIKALKVKTNLKPTNATELQHLFEQQILSKIQTSNQPLIEEYYVNENGNAVYKFSLKYGEVTQKQHKKANPAYLEVKQQINVIQRHRG